MSFPAAADVASFVRSSFGRSCFHLFLRSFFSATEALECVNPDSISRVARSMPSFGSMQLASLDTLLLLPSSFHITLALSQLHLPPPLLSISSSLPFLILMLGLSHRLPLPFLIPCLFSSLVSSLSISFFPFFLILRSFSSTSFSFSYSCPLLYSCFSPS